MEYADLYTRVGLWRRRIDEAAVCPVQICAATKTQSIDIINALPEMGITLMGENRVQELMSKADRLNPSLRVDMIGHLQTNKVKYIIDCVQGIQSVDSPSLAQEINSCYSRAGKSVRVLIQVNIANEAQKYGVREAELWPLAKLIASLPALRLEGLMAIMPISPDPEALRPLFRRMRALFDRLKEEPFGGPGIVTLSMGMSSDCIVAAQEGATMVRLGTALFGVRPAPPQAKYIKEETH